MPSLKSPGFESKKLKILTRDSGHGAADVPVELVHLLPPDADRVGVEELRELECKRKSMVSDRLMAIEIDETEEHRASCSPRLAPFLNFSLRVLESRDRDSSTTMKIETNQGQKNLQNRPWT